MRRNAVKTLGKLGDGQVIPILQVVREQDKAIAEYSDVAGEAIERIERKNS